MRITNELLYQVLISFFFSNYRISLKVISFDIILEKNFFIEISLQFSFTILTNEFNSSYILNFFLCQKRAILLINCPDFSNFSPIIYIFKADKRRNSIFFLFLIIKIPYKIPLPLLLLLLLTLLIYYPSLFIQINKFNFLFSIS